MMNHEIKKMIVDAIMKVVSDAPTRQYIKYNPYSYMSNLQYNNQSKITKEKFDIWLNYALSVLKIISEDIDIGLYATLRDNVQNIANQPSNNYELKINSICQLLLSFARQIINL